MNDPRTSRSNFPWTPVISIGAIGALFWWLCSRGWLPGCQGPGGLGPAGEGEAEDAAEARKRKQTQQQQTPQQVQQQVKRQRQQQKLQQLRVQLQQLPEIPVQRRPRPQELTNPITVRFIRSPRDPDVFIPALAELEMPNGDRVTVHGWDADPRRPDGSIAWTPDNRPDLDRFYQRMDTTFRQAARRFPQAGGIVFHDPRDPEGNPVLSQGARRMLEQVAQQTYPLNRIDWKIIRWDEISF